MKNSVKLVSAFCAAALVLFSSGCSAGNSSDREGGSFPNAMGAMTIGDARREQESFSTEEYRFLPENGFRSVAANPLSTLSADVDTASYSNVRRMLNGSGEVDPSAVRVEEMLNYFHYDYPAPADGQPFSITTELSECPWNPETKLLLIGLQAKEVDFGSIPPSNLVFLIDVSGSMYSYDKLPLVQQAFLLLTENLREEDRISIVTYASGDRVVLDGASGADKARISAAVESLEAGGSTAGSEGIETAYRIAKKHFIEGGNNRVILATDGDLNVGVTSEGELTRLVQQKRDSGVYLSVLGFGTGNIKDNKMSALADNGNGNYAYIDTPLEARRVLVEEMGGTLLTVAQDVKLQVAFNPARLKGYRLVGYEKRLLDAEDFADDQADAGEIGAGHRVTVLYELADSDSAQEIPEVELKYQLTVPSGSDEWLTVSVRYKEPGGSESRLLEAPVGGDSYRAELPDNLAFAASVAEFGMLLGESEYSGSASYAGILERLQGRADIREDSYKAEFLELVEGLAYDE